MFPELKAICLHCMQPNLLSALECRKCGAPLTEATVIQPVQQITAPSATIIREDNSAEAGWFESVVSKDLGHWMKQTIEYKQPGGEVTVFHIPRAGLLVHVTIDYCRSDIKRGAYNIQAVFGAMAPLINVTNSGENPERFNMLWDTQAMADLHMEVNCLDHKPASAIIFKLDRWVPTEYNAA